MGCRVVEVLGLGGEWEIYLLFYINFQPQLNLLGHRLDFLVICTMIGDARTLIRPVVVVPSSIMTATDVGSGPH